MSWLTLFLIGVATFSLRSAFILIGRGDPALRVAAVLRFVPAAVLPALATSAVIGNGAAALPPRIAAAAVAALVVWRFRSVAGAMIAGMAVLWALIGAS